MNLNIYPQHGIFFKKYTTDVTINVFDIIIKIKQFSCIYIFFKPPRLYGCRWISMIHFQFWFDLCGENTYGMNIIYTTYRHCPPVAGSPRRYFLEI